MCRHECVKLRIFLFRSSEVKHIWPKLDFHHITMSEWKVRRGKSSQQGCPDPALQGHNPAGFSIRPSRNHFRWEKWEPWSTWADRNPGGIAIFGDWMWTLLSYSLSKVTASPLLDWPHHSRPAESPFLQRLLVEPFPALAFAHKPIVFPLKVSETEEWVAYLVCLCSPSSLWCLGFLALIYGMVNQLWLAQADCSKILQDTVSPTGPGNRWSVPAGEIIHSERAVRCHRTALCTLCNQSCFILYIQIDTHLMSLILRRKQNWSERKSGAKIKSSHVLLFSLFFHLKLGVF